MATQNFGPINNSHVPYRNHLLFSSIVQSIFLILVIELVDCQQNSHLMPIPVLQPQEDYYLDENVENSSGTDISSQSTVIDSSKPTPPLRMASHRSDEKIQTLPDNTNSITLEHCTDCSQPIISAARVLRAEHYAYGTNNLFSPIFNFHTIVNSESNPADYQGDGNNLISELKPQNLIDTNNGFDLIESGSGAGWDGRSFDDTTNVLEDSNTQNELVAPTPVLNLPSDLQSTPSLTDFNYNSNYNRAPVLNRRLPKLAVTAGQVWRYFIPYDTFLDEDGDLRQLKSTVVRKLPTIQAIGATNVTSWNDQYYSWLQYDPTSYLLYGFPTENDSGKHEIVFVVTDRFGDSSNETIEINVRQHQSTRAFTHVLVANQVAWDPQSFPSVVDAMGEFVKRIMVQVYLDQSFKDFIVQYFSMSSQSLNSNNASSQNIMEPIAKHMNLSFIVAWSNGLAPIHPCNLTYLGNMLRPLIDTQALESEWSIEKSNKLELTPSQNLVKALEPEFKLDSISMILQGSCEGKDSSENGNVQELNPINTSPRIRIKIGKLNWKLGEPIEYRIPSETFTVGEGTHTTRDLQLSMHTIDGLTLDKDRKYSYLEFDQEDQTLYGLPYDQEDHSGQRELQLTARHPKTGDKIREVFIINIQPQDLTTMNNRAFKLSIYLIARTVRFGPKERVALSHRIMGALRVGSADSRHERENPQMVVMDVQKFSLGSNWRDENGSPSLTNYREKITRITDNNINQPDDSYLTKNSPIDDGARIQSNVLYKFTWTNETIGFRGDCPVEVIKENILYALEQSMLESRFPDSLLGDESEKNDSVRFHDRLRLYFEPESDLIHLRFEPLSACVSALELHDVGNGEIADRIDRAEDPLLSLNQEPQSMIDSRLPPVIRQTEIDSGDDEYWSIILVLIIMVAVFIFVVVMFALGLHTYKINQDKRFELQVRLAQARQNSMYLSSMILANQATPNDIRAQVGPAGRFTKSMYVVQNEEKGSRKPVILDNEKQFLDRSQMMSSVEFRPTTVQLSGQSVHTMPMKPNMTFTLDSIASSSLQSKMNLPNPHTVTLMPDYLDDKQRSVTLHRGPSQSIQRFMNQQPLVSNLNHSQSIITVASLAAPIPLISQANLPVMYTPSPIFNPPHQNFASLRRPSHPEFQPLNHNAQTPQNHSSGPIKRAPADTASNLNTNGANGSLQPYNKMSSSSYSSSNSATNQSVISNSNFRG